MLDFHPAPGPHAQQCLGGFTEIRRRRCRYRNVKGVEVSPPQPTSGLGERRELSQPGQGWRPSRKRPFCTSECHTTLYVKRKCNMATDKVENFLRWAFLGGVDDPVPPHPPKYGPAKYTWVWVMLSPVWIIACVMKEIRPKLLIRKVGTSHKQSLFYYRYYRYVDQTYDILLKHLNEKLQLIWKSIPIKHRQARLLTEEDFT